MSIAEEIYDYVNLERAYLETTGYAEEETVINLQNHLVWGSYKADGSITDKVLIRAILRSIDEGLTVAGGKDENHLVPYGLRYPDGEQRRA